MNQTIPSWRHLPYDERMAQIADAVYDWVFHFTLLESENHVSLTLI